MIKYVFVGDAAAEVGSFRGLGVRRLEPETDNYPDVFILLDTALANEVLFVVLERRIRPQGTNPIESVWAYSPEVFEHLVHGDYRDHGRVIGFAAVKRAKMKGSVQKRNDWTS